MTKHREAVFDMIREFAISFSKQGAHNAKILRYVDVLEGCDLEHIRIGLDALKGEGSMPAPSKIREAIETALLRRVLERERVERDARLRQLADPAFRQEMRDERAVMSEGLVGLTDVLRQLVADVNRDGLVGETRAVMLVFLALHTRHFNGRGQRPVSVVVKGSSSSGKSETVKAVKRFLADGSVIEMTGMSPKWLVYASQQGITFANKFLFVHEATGVNEEVEAMLRVLLSEHRLVWRTVIDQVAHTLEVEGPTGLIETTTRISIHAENETRMLSVPVNDGTAQTRRVLHAISRDPVSAVHRGAREAGRTSC
jgi:hypothetical protein